MSVSQVEIFVKSAALGSLTLAAEALGCTQSNASHAIGALEKEIGVPLLARSRAGARLTPEGEALLPAAKALVESEKAFREKCRALSGLKMGQLRIGTFTSVAVHWLPALLSRFRAEYPQISFEIWSGDYHELGEWLRAGQVDLALVRLPAEAEGCTLTPLYEDPLVAILPPSHPLAALERVPMTALTAEPFISLPENSDHDTLRPLREAGFSPEVRYTTQDDYALLAMVESGLGVSVVPSLLLENRAERLAVRPLEPPASRVIALALPEKRASDPAVSRFAQFVLQYRKPASEEAGEVR